MGAGFLTISLANKFANIFQSCRLLPLGWVAQGKADRPVGIIHLCHVRHSGRKVGSQGGQHSRWREQATHLETKCTDHITCLCVCCDIHEPGQIISPIRISRNCNCPKTQLPPLSQFRRHRPTPKHQPPEESNRLSERTRPNKPTTPATPPDHPTPNPAQPAPPLAKAVLLMA